VNVSADELWKRCVDLKTLINSNLKFSSLVCTALWDRAQQRTQESWLLVKTDLQFSLENFNAFLYQLGKTSNFLSDFSLFFAHNSLSVIAQIQNGKNIGGGRRRKWINQKYPQYDPFFIIPENKYIVKKKERKNEENS